MLTVNFCYKDHGYNYPIISTAEEMRKFGFTLNCYKVENVEQTRQYWDNCDIYLCHPDVIPPYEICEKICVALVSDADGGWIAPYIRHLPYVRGYIESYAYSPRDLHNEPFYYYNMEVLKRWGFKRTSDGSNDFPIPAYDVQNKIHVHCGFGSWERMKGITCEEVDLKAPRTNPVFFAGTVEYCGTEIETHRMAAVQVCKEVGGIGVAGRLVQWKEYRETFLNTKAILSPWGWGEACHRDYEALAWGCVLVKPDWSFVESFPDLSSHEAPYIPCRPDFTDVPAIIEDLENHWDSYEPLRQRGRELAKEALNITANAKRLAEILQCLT